MNFSINLVNTTNSPRIDKSMHKFNKTLKIVNYPTINLIDNPSKIIQNCITEREFNKSAELWSTEFREKSKYEDDWVKIGKSSKLD